MDAEPYKVVVWGDSIAAAGWPQTAEFTCNVALNTGRPVKIINKGVCGQSAAAARRCFESEILANNPDLVILQFGFNDVRHDGSRGALPLSTLEEFEDHLTAMVRLCREKAHAAVMIFGNHRTRSLLTMPTGLRYDEARARYNEVACRVAGRTGVRYLDMAEVINAAGLDYMDVVSEDGVHLSPLGLSTYAQIAASEIAGTVTAVPKPA